MTRRALVCGAGGFIGGHLVERLKAEGYWVRGVDAAEPQYRDTRADEYSIADLRVEADCARALAGDRFDEVYQLAADMGGMEFISAAEPEIMRNSALINAQMINAAVAAGAGRYFLSSSVCVYRDMEVGEAELTEADAYPAHPDNEYGWEKLYAERLVQAWGRRYGIPVHIARFQNTYGPYGAWRGGREKAPAAICRKVAEAESGGHIEAFGNGSAVRTYVYVDDLIDGIRLLMSSDLEGPTNIGTRDQVTVVELVETVASVAGKTVSVRWVDGPVGVQSRNFSNDRIESLGFQPKFSLRDGLGQTYEWVAQQVGALRRRGARQ